MSLLCVSLAILQVLVEMLWMTQVYMHEQRSHLQQLVTVLNKC